ncbi:hypothetical protein WJX84_007348 [Apatococcus fuscideae]|uniref:Uncharacterized protein n=1 Tax=Apatococcus fuscideae TaxID=2026836 RepID=A0AAW1SS39_9CHLO
MMLRLEGKMHSCPLFSNRIHSLSSRPLPCPSRVLRASTRRVQPCRAASSASQASLAEPAAYEKLKEVYDYLQSLPPSDRQGASNEILTTLNSLKKDGKLQKFGKRLEERVDRRNVFMGELRRVGVKVPDSIGKLSVRNDAAFLITVVGTTSVVAVAAGFLPGDWGFFVPYLTGGISIATLVIGSTAPGFLQFFIDKFAQVFPDYRERVLRHEAAHLLDDEGLG